MIQPLLNTITEGDCMAVLKTIPDGSVDMILTDPPYGVTDCSWDKRLPTEKFFNELRRVIKDHGVIALTATQPYATDLINAGRDIFRYDLVWDKRQSVGFLNSRRMPLRRHELVLIFYKHLPNYHPQFLPGSPYRRRAKNSTTRSGVYRAVRTPAITDNPGVRYPTSILEVPREMGSRKRPLYHQTQKPLTLFEWLINTYSNPGEIVLDPCVGSGTTAVACVRVGRSFIAIEKDHHFCKVAEKRLKEELPTEKLIA
jgi:site-specific DNA-methyltransferase (adenine-specific)